MACRYLIESAIATLAGGLFFCEEMLHNKDDLTILYVEPYYYSRPANLKHQKILRFTIKQQLIHTRIMNLYVYILLEETKKNLESHRKILRVGRPATGPKKSY